MEMENIRKAVGEYCRRRGIDPDGWRPKAALIDMDGTLIDSMRNHTAAWKRLSDELGLNADRDEFYIYEGMTGRATIRLLFKRAKGYEPTDDECDELYARKARYFNEMPKVPVIPGADRMLNLLVSRGITRVLVTGSKQLSNLDRLDVDFPGAFPHDLRITAADVSRGKPHPEPYLKGMSLAGTLPEESLVIENAPLGVEAGKASGAFVIAVTTGPVPRESLAGAGADLVFGSMEELADALPGILSSGNRPVFTNDVARVLDEALGRLAPSSIHILVDDNTEAFVLPLLRAESEAVARAKVIRVKSGEVFKNLDSLASVWKQLGEDEANRRSVMINLGGGVVTDMGAFAAATFKRGISFINIPTTLLCAVDASVGGKTGINFNGLKNEIGVFHDADLVIISTIYFNTLTSQELLSGYAEMLKHALISSTELTGKMLSYNVDDYDADTLLGLLEKSVAVKQRYVDADHDDRGVRRALNFGHTIGHAFESLALERKSPIPHGYAVAFGMVGALVLSRIRYGFPSGLLNRYVGYVREHYGAFGVSCDDYKHLLALMHRDKKNDSRDVVNFTLLKSPGEVEINVPVDDDDIIAALDIYRDLLGLP